MYDITVLLAEDDPLTRLSVSESLSQITENVLVYSDGREALESIRTNAVDLLVTDIRMPEMDGFTLIETLRQEGYDLPVIVISAYNEKSNYSKAMDLNVDQLLNKPLRIQVLFDAIAKSAEKIATQRLNRQQQNLLERCRAVINNSYQAILATDTDGIITLFSPAAEKLLGYRSDEAVGFMTPMDFIDLSEVEGFDQLSAEDREIELKEYFTMLVAPAIAGNVNLGEWTFITRSKERKTVHLSISALKGSDGDLNGFMGIAEDVTAQKEAEKKILELTIKDDLTNLYNRRFFHDIFRKELGRARRERKGLAFLMIDVDGFKNYNDYYGHQAGDTALVKVGEVLLNTSQRGGDYGFRFGGEEFGILSSADGVDEALKLAEKIRNEIEMLEIPHRFNPPWNVLTVSIGVVFENDLSEVDKDSIYKMADIKLYEAKKNGKNRVM